MLRLLHVAPFFHDGVGVVAHSLTKEFVKLNNEVILASPIKLPPDLIDLNITYYSLRRPILKDPFYSVRFYVLNKSKKVARCKKPDIVLTNDPLLIIIDSNIRDVSIVSIVHDISFYLIPVPLTVISQYPCYSTDKSKELSKSILKFLRYHYKGLNKNAVFLLFSRPMSN